MNEKSNDCVGFVKVDAGVLGIRDGVCVKLFSHSCWAAELPGFMYYDKLMTYTYVNLVRFLPVFIISNQLG